MTNPTQIFRKNTPLRTLNYEIDRRRRLQRRTPKQPHTRTRTHPLHRRHTRFNDMCSSQRRRTQHRQRRRICPHTHPCLRKFHCLSQRHRSSHQRVDATHRSPLHLPPHRRIIHPISSHFYPQFLVLGSPIMDPRPHRNGPKMHHRLQQIRLVFHRILHRNGLGWTPKCLRYLHNITHQDYIPVNSRRRHIFTRCHLLRMGQFKVQSRHLAPLRNGRKCHPFRLPNVRPQLRIIQTH